jgi:hypothetical protein
VAVAVKSGTDSSAESSSGSEPEDQEQFHSFVSPWLQHRGGGRGSDGEEMQDLTGAGA